MVVLAGLHHRGQGGTQLTEAGALLVEDVVELAVVALFGGGGLDDAAPGEAVYHI